MADILIAEDVDLQARLLQVFLQSEHTVVGVAQNGEQAIELTRLSDPDIVVMDINMPKRDGIQATQEITRLYPQISVIVSTAVVNEESRQAAFDAGAKEILTKPFGNDELLDVIESTV